MSEPHNNNDNYIDFATLCNKFTELDRPPATETELDEDVIALFQVVGITQQKLPLHSNCIIKEVGTCEESSKANVMIHREILNNNIINIFTIIYDIYELNILCSAPNSLYGIIGLQIINDQLIIGDYTFCFVPSKQLNVNISITGYKKPEILLDGTFCIFDVIENKIIKTYKQYIGHTKAIAELINAISN
jgi:hypothetical protein